MSDYNGWTNRETWLINLWLGDDISEFGFNDMSPDSLETFVQDLYYHFTSTISETYSLKNMWLDFIDLGDINYQELSDHYRSEFQLQLQYS
tara:strand:- start:376 stop:648 length:273 start_codon:yes stop_codon:yes gene_type:complete